MPFPQKMQMKKACPKRTGFYSLCTIRQLALNDSAYRAATSARTAVDASVSVDCVLAVALSDSAYGALTSAGTAADASVSNFISHE